MPLFTTTDARQIRWEERFRWFFWHLYSREKSLLCHFSLYNGESIYNVGWRVLTQKHVITRPAYLLCCLACFPVPIALLLPFPVPIALLPYFPCLTYFCRSPWVSTFALHVFILLSHQRYSILVLDKVFDLVCEPINQRQIARGVWL